jgi:hypothetical protein
MKHSFILKIRNRFLLSDINLRSIVGYDMFGRMPFIVYIVSIISLTSCVKSVEEISWDVKDHPPMLVVDASVTNELKNQGIRLTLSDPYFSTDAPEPVHGASVSINEGNNLNNFTESPDYTGWYYSDEPFAGVSGKTYNLQIELQENVNGRKDYTSSSTMPEGLDIDSIQCSIYALPEVFSGGDADKIKDTTILVVFYFGNEPESPGNYYFAKIYRNNAPSFSNVKSYPFTSDNERNGEYVNYMAIIKNVADRDSITFNLCSVNKEYYEYIDAISKMDQTGDIYSPQGPPANALGNVEGALGFFLATCISTGKSVAIDMR